MAQCYSPKYAHASPPQIGTALAQLEKKYFTHASAMPIQSRKIDIFS